MNQTLLTPGPLHDDQGHLVQAGYATYEAKTYDRSAIRAPWYRIKEWDYYCVLGDDWGIACVIADNSYMGLLSAVWLDFTSGQQIPIVSIPPLTRGRIGLPSSIDQGDVSATHGGLSLSFTHENGVRRLQIDCPDFDKGKGLSADIQLSHWDHDRMTIATPWEHDPRCFYYNQKINNMRASGQVTYGQDSRQFDPERHFGLLDWGRGVWAYNNTWYWGSASGLVDGHRFGFNIGYGFGDTSAASENMLFWDGVAHKLDQVEFHIPEPDFTAPWRFTSNDGRFEMNFTPLLDRADISEFVVIRNVVHQVFGRFSGTATLDDGSVVQVKDLLGFAEKVITRW